MSDYSVFGGEGGLKVVTDELRAEAARFASAEGHLAACGSKGFFPVPNPYGVVFLHPRLRDAATHVSITGQLAWNALTAAKTKLSALSAQLTSCVTNYQAAEERAKARPGGFGSGILDIRGQGGGHPPAGAPDDFPVGVVSLFSPIVALIAAKSQLNSAGTDAITVLAHGAAQGAPPGLEVSAAAAKALAERANAGHYGLLDLHRLGSMGALTGLADKFASAGPIVIGDPTKLGDAPKADGLAGLVSLQGRAWDGTGQLLYTRVVDSRGRETWVVTIPGTQDAKGGVWGSKRIAEAMSGQTGNVSAAVLNGLARVGAKPGARLVLSGHSQGGRHAINLASDKVLSSRFNVSGVVTAGAPSGTQETPRGVKVIQLEDPDDPVPGLDGAAGVPTSTERLLVRSTSGASQHKIPGQDGGVLGWEHKVANYKELAAKADKDGGVSLARAIDALGIKGGESTTYLVPTSPPPAPGPPASPPQEKKILAEGKSPVGRKP